MATNIGNPDFSIRFAGDVPAGTNLFVLLEDGHVPKRVGNTLTSVDPATFGGGGGISDGDKGNITVSSSGTVWTIDDGVVTTSKLGGDITSAGKALLDDASVSDQRTTLGLGSAATASSASFAAASHSHAAAEVISGTLDTARLGSGTANNAKYLRGDSTWQNLVGAALGDASSKGLELLAAADSAAARTALGLGSMATQNATSVAIVDGTAGFANAGFSIADVGGSFALIISPGSTLTADRTLTITTGDANRTLTLSGSATISGTNTGDQTLASLGLDTTDSPQFAALNVGHASDTTITRVSAGVLAVEGATIATLPLTARLTADVGPNSTIHTTSMADVTGAVLSLAANTTYMVEIVVIFTTSASTEGLVLGLTFPAVVYVGFEVIIPNADNGTGQGFHGQIIASGGKVIGTGRPNTTPATGPWVATIRGIIRPSASGNLQLTYGTETGASGVNCTIKSGTVVEARVVP